MEKVSVICPLYNKVKYVKDTIDSVKEQSYGNWELLVIDDGSTDGSYECVKEIVERDNRNIVLLKRTDFSPNKGASVCRNIGIEISKGDFIMFLDCDDILSKNALMKRISYIRQYPDYSFYVFKEAYFVDDPANLYKRAAKYWLERMEYSLAGNKKEFFLKKFLIYDLPWHTSSPLWRKEALVKVKGFREDFQRLQDPELHTRILLEREINFKIFRYTVSPDVFIRASENRRHTNNISHFNTHVNSIKNYVRYFSRYLSSCGHNKKIKYLEGYLLSAEQTGNYYLNTAGYNEKGQYINELDSLYKDEYVYPLVNERYRRFVSVLRVTAAKRWLLKMKVPAVFIKVYKFFI